MKISVGIAGVLSAAITVGLSGVVGAAEEPSSQSSAVVQAVSLGLPATVVASPVEGLIDRRFESSDMTIELSNAAVVAGLLADPATTDGQREFLENLSTEASFGVSVTSSVQSTSLARSLPPGCGSGGSGSWGCVYYMHSQCSRLGSVENYLNSWTGMSGDYKSVTNVSSPSLAWNQQYGWALDSYPAISQGGVNSGTGWTTIYASWRFLAYGWQQQHYQQLSVQADSSYTATFQISCP